ncbi:RluA family pseudouridine synthase [Lacticaseibacillus yichunensis]|uniref:RNA pseudouridylate synthase n=1 Tax=Lacticaseibacillus yichunensis TaxID=2486015 RepID=A0ABW4CQS2_9LACO|nr:RluA family pseudouridine synthase [Lacticaseibacillus yichunensis]
MPIFTLHETAPAAASVRALLSAWLVPKKTQHLLRINKAVTIDGFYQNFNEPVAAGAQVTLTLRDDAPPTYALAAEPPTIVFEDDQVLICDKAPGVKPHPNQPGENGTLLNQAARYLDPRPAYITHRLDMATSGLMLIAKDPLTQAIIDRELAVKTMTRSYVALVPAGLPASGMITAPIGEDPDDKRKRMVRPDGLPAVTHYETLAVRDGIARLRLTLETGRTHQLRVHLASIGAPIIGDPLYSTRPASRLMLHAAEMRLIEPLSSRDLHFESPVPF